MLITILTLGHLSFLCVHQKESRRHKQKQRHKDRTRHSERGDGRDNTGFRQCLGPSCVDAARPNSKYCSEDCGMKLAAKYDLSNFPFRHLLSAIADECNISDIVIV